MTQQQTKTVTIGEDEKRIRPFKGIKGIYAGSILAGVTDQAQAIMDADSQYRRDYADNHRQRVPESLAVIREWVFDDRLWKTDDTTGERYVELPSYPTDEQRYMHGFNAAFRLARDQVLQLMALVLIDDDRLYDTEDEGGEPAVRDLLLKEGRILFRQATIGELVDLAYVAFEVVRDEMASRSGKLQAVTGLFGLTLSSKPTPPADEPSESEPETTSTPETSESTPPESSTDSPTPTDGDAETSSPDIVGANSSA